MDSGDFWRVIDSLQPLTDSRQLVLALQGFPADEIVAFEVQLREAIQALNTHGHRGQRVRDIGEPSSVEPLPLSDDSFLYLRLAVVGRGSRAWTAAMEDPSQLEGAWDLDLGEQLSEAVGEAFEQVTGEPWAHLSLDQPPASPASSLPRLRRNHWFGVYPTDEVIYGLDGKVADHLRLPGPYRQHLEYLSAQLNSDRQWWDWWDRARGVEALLECDIDFSAVARPRSSLRVRQQTFDAYEEVAVRLIVPFLDQAVVTASHSNIDVGWSALASKHFDLLFDRVHRKLGLQAPTQLKPDIQVAVMQRHEWEQQTERAEQAEAEGFEAYQRHRSSEHIWRGRAPDEEVDDLIDAVNAGQRIVALPQLIAELRHRHAIPPSTEDSERLAEAGYSADEITIALR